MAEDTDGLNASDWYVVDIPGYDATEQPGGAHSGESAVIHVYKNGLELILAAPSKGKIIVGGSGSTQQIDVAIQMSPEITVTDSVSPSDDLQIPFGNLAVNLILERLVKITNEGNADLVLGNIAQNNQLAAPFTLNDENICSGKTLPKAASCTFKIQFSTTATGPFNDTFDILSNDPDENTITINVSGTGLNPTNQPSMPNLISPLNGQTGLSTTLDFKWRKCTDPDSDTVSYTLYYSDDPDLMGSAPIQVASFRNSGIYYAGTGVGLLLFGIVLNGGVRIRKNLLPVVVIIVIYIMLLVSCGSGGGGGGGSNGSGGGGGGGGSNDVTQNVSGLSSNTTYYWKVIADDGKGGVTESSTYSFTTN